MCDIVLCKSPKNGDSRHEISVFFNLFVFSVITAVGRSRTVKRRRRRLRRTGRGRRRRGIVPPLPLLFILLGGGGADLHKDDVHADLGHVFEVDEEVGLPPPKASAARGDDAEHLALGLAEHDVAHLSEPFSVAEIDDFLLLQFQKTRFHTTILCGQAKKVSAKRG